MDDPAGEENQKQIDMCFCAFEISCRLVVLKALVLLGASRVPEKNHAGPCGKVFLA